MINHFRGLQPPKGFGILIFPTLTGLPTLSALKNINGKQLTCQRAKLLTVKKYRTKDVEMQQTEPLKYGQFYHLYNRGNNSCDLFRNRENYEHFLGLYDKYISPVAETYAWVLMPNHFHLLVKLKEDVVYKYSNADRSADAVRFEEHKWETVDLSACEAPDSVRIPEPHRHFSHLFNSYSKYFNAHFDRHGNLFERPFKRKLITNEKYLKHVVLYIHNNPVNPVK